MKISKQNLISRAKKIKLMLLDVDGVMTDGSIILDNNGNEAKVFHVRDGRGVKLAQKEGLIFGIITGRSSEVVAVRARELGITEVFQGAQEKIVVYESLLRKYNLSDSEVAYMGDDDIDLAVLKRVGLAATVADCDPCVKPVVHIVTRAGGGRGAVREVINVILKSRGKARLS